MNKRIPDTTTIRLELDDREAVEFEALFENPILQQIYYAYKYPDKVGNRLICLSFGDGETDYTFFQARDIRTISSSIPFPKNYAKGFDYPDLSDSPLDGIDPKWSQWIVDKLNEGYSREGIYRVLLDQGVNHDRASEILCYRPDIDLEISEEIDRETIYPLLAGKQCERWRIQSNYVEMYLVEDFVDPVACECVIDLIGDNVRVSGFSKPKSYENAVNSSTYTFRPPLCNTSYI